jgi:CBS domain-containing protein
VPEMSRTSQVVADIIDSGGSTDLTVGSDEPLDALLANVELRRLGGLAAVDAAGRLTGIVTLEQVGRALRDAAA